MTQCGTRRGDMSIPFEQCERCVLEAGHQGAHRFPSDAPARTDAERLAYEQGKANAEAIIRLMDAKVAAANAEFDRKLAELEKRLRDEIGSRTDPRLWGGG